VMIKLNRTKDLRGLENKSHLIKRKRKRRLRLTSMMRQTGITCT